MDDSLPARLRVAARLCDTLARLDLAEFPEAPEAYVVLSVLLERAAAEIEAARDRAQERPRPEAAPTDR